MRTDVDHLPHRNQRELQWIVETIFDEFDKVTAEHGAAWKKKGRIHKIILYGSHARGSQVWEPHTAKGYRSDYDLLIIVNTKRLTDRALFWINLEKRFNDAMNDDMLRAPVSFIVHSRQEVNNALVQGRYFFIDIAREGIAIYQDDDTPLPKPVPKSPDAALAIAREYFSGWYPDSADFYESFQFSLGKGHNRNAAFQLHQAVEQLYHCALLVRTFYTPHVHNIRALRQLAEQLDRRLVYVWPTDNRRQIAAFNKLQEAYVKARYSKHYRITTEQLTWLGDQAQELARVVQLVCNERIEALEAEVASDNSEASRGRLRRASGRNA